MPTTGGRDDIGLIPKQTAIWIFSSGDWRQREIALTNSDLAGAWMNHVREGNTTRYFDKGKTLSGMGRPVSIYGRPTVWILDSRGPGQEAVVPLPSPLVFDTYSPANWVNMTKQGWTRDSAHTPDAFYVPYMLTGDYFYLEGLQFWAAYGVLEWCVGNSYCRGPMDTSKPLAGIQGQIRANAWTFRGRSHAAFISPDGTPEKSYFQNVTEEAIAFWEGWKNITGTAYEGTFAWTWARDNIFKPVVPGLFVMENDESLVDGPINATVCGGAVSMWMECTRRKSGETKDARRTNSSVPVQIWCSTCSGGQRNAVSLPGLY